MDRIVEVKVNGNYITKDNKNAGAQGECNMTALRIEFDEGWDGFAKTVTWWNSRNQNPVKRTLTADQLEDITKSTRIYTTLIPGEPLEFPGMCRFVIDGYSDDKRQRSLQDELLVKPVERADDAGNPVDPIPSQAEQLQVQIDSMLGDMQERAVRAETAAAEAKASENIVKDSVEAAANSAAEALASENLASSYMQGAQLAAGDAAASAGTAAEHAQEAAGSAQAAAGQTVEMMRSEMVGYVNAAQEAQMAAEKAKDEVKEIAGGDYATSGELDAVEQTVETAKQALEAHESNTNNPHGVTAEQVGAAPAGFGLGGNAKTLTASDDLNNITACGWYMWDTRPANCIDVIANGQMLVLNGVWGLVTQVVYGTKGPVVQRSCYYGTWQPWEWRDPPMESGVEYRTIERITDKAVYKRNNGGTIEYRLDGETEWKPYADVVGAEPTGLSYGRYHITSGTDEDFLAVIDGVYASMNDASVRHIVVSFGNAHPVLGGGAYLVRIYRASAVYGVITAVCYSYSTGSMEYSRSYYNGAWKDFVVEINGGNISTYAAPASHNQAASTITGGILAGQVWANPTTSATVTQYQVRNICAQDTDLTAGSSEIPSGYIVLVYE